MKSGINFHEYNQLKEMYDNNATVEEIATFLDVSTQVVENWIDHYTNPPAPEILDEVTNTEVVDNTDEDADPEE